MQARLLYKLNIDHAGADLALKAKTCQFITATNNHGGTCFLSITNLKLGQGLVESRGLLQAN